jgi:hypothetical protein
MDSHELPRFMALFYAAGIIAAAIVFRIVRARRKRKQLPDKPLF